VGRSLGTNLMPVAAKFAKSAKSKHRKVVWRDALSAQAFEAAAKTGALGVRVRAIVIEDGKLRVARKRRSSAPKAWARKGTRYSVSHWKEPHPRWLDTVKPTLKAHRTCAPWRDITDTFKAHLSHVSLSLNGNVWAFTLNLHRDIEEQAVDEGSKAANWLSNRLTRYLRGTLARKPLYWFRLEEGGKSPYMHLHGELVCENFEMSSVDIALCKAGGEWERSKRGFQTKLEKYPDTGWVSYVMKSDYKHTISRALSLLSATPKPPEPSWRDKRFFISQELSRQAKALYEDVRTALRINATPIRKAA
jgi:hypothetical protein